MRLTLACCLLALECHAGLAAEFTVGGDRPAPLFVPASYDPDIPTPLILALHGYSSSGADFEEGYHFEPLAEDLGFLYCYPDGTLDLLRQRFWNATDACCRHVADGPHVDDVAYLLGLIDEIAAGWNVAPGRVYVTGHSNGGFMSHRLACDLADRIAAIAAYSGVLYFDEARCDPAAPVHVLQVHGTADSTIRFDGGDILRRPYPSAEETVARWVAYNDCSPQPGIPSPLDLLASVPGDETEIESYDDCAPNGSVEFWRVVNGGHRSFRDDPVFTRAVVEWLLARRKHPPVALRLRGDANDDASVGLTDVLFVLDWLFLGGPTPGCVAAVNNNGDRFVDVSDAIFLLHHLFLGAAPPAAPFPGCGPSDLPEDEALGCEEPPRSCR